MLILASQRIEDVLGWDYGGDVTKRGSKPSLVESCILAWVAGLIWSEIKQLWDVGLKEYISDMWNVVDFITNSLYVATIGLRTVAYFDVSHLEPAILKYFSTIILKYFLHNCIKIFFQTILKYFSFSMIILKYFSKILLSRCCGRRS